MDAEIRRLETDKEKIETLKELAGPEYPTWRVFNEPSYNTELARMFREFRLEHANDCVELSRENFLEWMKEGR